jgi:hypothetical protein
MVLPEVKQGQAAGAGIVTDEIQSDQGADAGTEHGSRLVGHGRKKARCVIAMSGEIDWRGADHRTGLRARPRRS